MHNAECTHLLLHSQKAEQRLVRLFVQSQDALPVLAIRLLLLQAVQGKERRVESRQQQREEQRGAAHHHNTARQRREREGEGRFYFNRTVMDKLKKINLSFVLRHLCCVENHLCSSMLASFLPLGGEPGGSGMMPPSSGSPGNRNLQTIIYAL